jgi:hypothetical protein
MSLIAAKRRHITDQIRTLIDLNETNSQVYRLWCEELTEFDADHAYVLNTGDLLCLKHGFCVGNPDVVDAIKGRLGIDDMVWDALPESEKIAHQVRHVSC